MKDFEKVNNCLLCDSSLKTIFDFGKTPLANDFSEYADFIEDDTFDLTLMQCQNCNNVQLDTIVDQERLFRDYLYVSGTSIKTREYFKYYAEQVISKFNLREGSLVCDIGSNDGTFLSYFKENGMRVLGIDPAKNIAEQANQNGIETIADFFNSDIVKQILFNYGKPNILICNNMFAHNKDLAIIIKGVIELLDNDGVFIFENSYLGDILDKNLFDTIYHEHIYTHYLTPLIKFFRKFGMKIFDVERTSNQGGSIRVFVCKNSANRKVEQSVLNLLKEEQLIPAKLEKFKENIAAFKQKMQKMVKYLQENKKIVDVYGYPAKSTTLLYAAGIEKGVFGYAYDDAALKIGKYSPGLHIPILSPEKLIENNPDFLFIGGWNFAESIIEKCRAMGYKGQFVIPLPEWKIIK